MIAVFIIFFIVVLVSTIYAIADFAFYLGYDRALSILLREWQKEIDVATKQIPENDDALWEKHMTKIDECAEVSKVLLDESNNIQLNKVLKEWWNERRRSKRDHKKPPVQADIKHEAVN